MSNKSNKSNVVQTVKTVDGDYGFTDDNQVVKVDEKPKRVRKPDPMPFKVMRSAMPAIDMVFYAIVVNKEIVEVFSKNLGTGLIANFRDGEMFELGKVIFSGRGSKKLVIAQSSDMEFISTWKPS